MSLVWQLREKLDAVAAHNRVLQQQRAGLQARVLEMERMLIARNESVVACRRRNEVLGSYLVLFILCWIHQRQKNRVLVAEVRRNWEKEVDDKNYLVTGESLGDKNDSKGEKEAIEIELEGKKFQSSYVEGVKAGKHDEKSSISLVEDISSMEEAIYEQMNLQDSAYGEDNDQRATIEVDISVLSKVQMLRRQLEDFRAILKLNETSRGSVSPKSPHRNRSNTAQPEYLKHRRTNSRQMRHSLEQPKSTVI